MTLARRRSVFVGFLDIGLVVEVDKQEDNGGTIDESKVYKWPRNETATIKEQWHSEQDSSKELQQLKYRKPAFSNNPNTKRWGSIVRIHDAMNHTIHRGNEES